MPVDFITNESLSLRGASPKARDVAISPKLVSRMEAGDNFEYAAHDIVTKFLSPSSIPKRLPRQASQDAFLAMTMFCLKGYENRNPVSNIKGCRISPLLSVNATAPFLFVFSAPNPAR